MQLRLRPPGAGGILLVGSVLLWSCGGGGGSESQGKPDAGGDASGDTGTDGGSDAGTDTGTDAAATPCSAGEFRCVGDALETCAADGTHFQPVATCKPGLCDAQGKQCDNCVPDEGACEPGGTSYKACDPTGQKEETTACSAPTPFCVEKAGKPACVECKTAADCPPSTSECSLAVCSADGACGLSPVAKGTPCGAPGAGGTCDGAGNCTYCVPGEKRCTGLVPETCDAKGQWVAGPPCSGAQPLCLAGACVQCIAATDCPASTNECLSPACTTNACGHTPKPQGTPCGAGAGTCNGSGQCNVCQPGSKTCNGNVPLVCGSNGQYTAQPACGGGTPQCDPSTASCVQCTMAAHCPGSSNPCLVAVCASNSCGFAPKPAGSACPGGTCTANGTCQVCTPGTVSCNGNNVLTCNAQGQYDPPVACSGASPFCLNGTCVQCLAAGNCPASPNECVTATCVSNSCGYAPKSQGTPCSGGSGTCNGSGQCNICQPGSTTCNGNIPLVCGSNGQYTALPPCTGSTPVCDPSTASCVQCTMAAHCPGSSNPCLTAVCTSNSCGFAPKPNGTSCVIGADAGSCSNGTCQLCTAGQVRCKPGTTNVRQVCDSNGQWQDSTCPSGTPVCVNGACQATPVCGDGVTEGNEQCDDGNATKCDGCEGCEKRRWLNLPGGAYVTFPGLAGKLPPDNACYELWARHPVIPEAIYLSSTSDASHSHILLRCLNGNTLQFGSENGLGTALVVQPAAPCGDNTWHHIAGCRAINGTQVTYTVYFDGQLKGSVTGQISSIATPSLPYTGGVPYLLMGLGGGSIDELRISSTLRYAGAFTPQRRFTSDASTVALFHFDEGTGSTATDSSPNTLTANLNGTTWSIDTGYLPSMCQ